MVVYFTSNVVSPPYTLFMGIDKHENEDLIRWGFPEDVWFHVDKVSSAHIYLRLHPDQTLDDVPQLVLEECAQLVKANSIKGNKMTDVDVVYTMWANLKKTGGMDVGQVGFHKEKEVRKIRVEKRCNETMNRLNKTRVEKQVDLKTEREDRDRQEKEKNKKSLNDEKAKEKQEMKRREEEKQLRSYSSLMKTDNMKTNKNSNCDDDDFM